MTVGGGEFVSYFEVRNYVGISSEKDFVRGGGGEGKVYSGGFPGVYDMFIHQNGSIVFNTIGVSCLARKISSAAAAVQRLVQADV